MLSLCGMCVYLDNAQQHGFFPSPLLLCKHGAKYWSDIDRLSTLLFHCFMEGFTVRRVRRGDRQKDSDYSKRTRKSAPS